MTVYSVTLPPGATLNILILPGSFSYRFVDGEIPAGTIPGTAFTLKNTPNPVGSLILVHDGVVQKPGGVDFTLAGNAITMVNTMFTKRESFICWYRF